MNELDQFVKHVLRVKNYARYTDDFVILADNREYLEALIPEIEEFLAKHLSLSLHPNKVSIRTYRQGIDFLGYVLLPDHTAVRRTTKRRIYRKVREKVGRFKRGEVSEVTLYSSLNSYLGVLSHADAHNVSEDLLNRFWFWMSD